MPKDHWYREFPEGSFRDERAIVYGITEDLGDDGYSRVFRVGMYVNIDTDGPTSQLIKSFEYPTRKEAEEHIRLWEPHSDIITHDGEPLPWDLPMEDCYEPWLKWLRVRGLTSALDDNHKLPGKTPQPSLEEENDWFYRLSGYENFRDDRMYVFEIDEIDLEAEGVRYSVEICVNVDGYNTLKYLEFDNFDEVERFIKIHEPRTFLFSLEGKRAKFDLDAGDIYEQWLRLMREKGIPSAIEAFEADKKYMDDLIEDFRNSRKKPTSS